MASDDFFKTKKWKAGTFKPINGKKAKGQGQGQGPGPGGGGTGGTGENDLPEFDDMDIDGDFQDTLDKLGNGKEAEVASPEEAVKTSTINSRGEGGKNSVRTPTRNAPTESRYSWKDILSKLLASAATPFSSYRRPHRSAATGVSAISATGSASIKPGEIQEATNFKLLFLFDSSGSMDGTVDKAIAAAQHVIKSKADVLHARVVMGIFANSISFYAADLADDTFWAIPDVDKMDPLPNTPIRKLSQLKQSLVNGGTNFTDSMANQLISAGNKGYNVVIFTDEDITGIGNKESFIKVYQSIQDKLFLILDSKSSWEYVCKDFGVKPDNFSHL
jgi:hypothetical protein